MKTSELALYEELRDALEKRLDPIRQATGRLDFGRDLYDLVKLEAIPGTSTETSAEILRAARHLKEVQERTNGDILALLAERERTMADFTPNHRLLVTYAIYRADLEMTGPKMATQCGHAYVDAHKEALKMRPEITAQYPGTGHGTKVCMYAKNLGQLLRAYRDAKNGGFPCKLIVDRGHVFPPHFDGKPIITAVGIGPVYQDEVKEITKRYTLAK